MKRLVERFFGIRTPIGRVWALALGILPLLLILSGWIWLTRGEIEERRGGSLLPQPEEVLQEAISLLGKQDATRNVYRAVLMSLQRVALGFLVAAGVCLPLGVLMGAFTRIGAVFRPLSIFGGYLPVAALVPLTLLWFGTDEKQKVMFLAIAAICYLLPLVVKAVEQVDEVYLQTAWTLGARKHQIVTKVLVPIAAAEIFEGMRLAFGVGWTYIMLAELIDAKEGVGSMILIAQRRSHPETVYFLVLLIVIVGFLLDKAFGILGRQLFPHRNAR
ncbi:MAG: ABC transporter permease subunit [Candidatus Brocadiae bacterium]|nr:ABC transporter permease subunit [Candidatus Brocadiia bacterium]